MAAVCTCCVYPSGDQVSHSAKWQSLLIVVGVFFAATGTWWLTLAAVMLKRRLTDSFFRHVVEKMQHFSATRHSKKELSVLDRKTFEIYNAERLIRYKLLLEMIAWFMTPGIVFAGAWAVFYTFRSDDINSLAVAAYSNCGLQGLIVSLVAMYFTTFKHQLTLNAADFIFGALYLSFTLSSIFADTNYLYVSANRPALMSQVMIGAAVADPTRILLPELLSFAIQIWLVLHNPNLALNWDQHLINRLVCSAYVFAVCFFLEGWGRKTARVIAREKEASRSDATANSLLSIMCDAVVGLRADLSIRGPCPRFQAMLLRAVRQQDQGEQASFVSGLRLEDQQRFLDFMANAELGQARSLHVHLVDSVGTPVSVQIFHTSQLDLADEVSHLIGICEARDDDYFPAPSMTDLPRRHKAKSASSSSLLVSTQCDQASEDQSIILGGSPTGCSSPGESAHGDSDDDSVSVADSESAAPSSRWLDPSSQPAISTWASGAASYTTVEVRQQLTYTVTNECPVSRALFNFEPSETILDHFVDRNSVACWLANFVMRAAISNELPDTACYGPTRIHNPRSGLDYEAHLEARAFPSRVVSQSQDEQELGMLQIILTEPKSKARRSRRRLERAAARFVRNNLSRPIRASI